MLFSYSPDDSPSPALIIWFSGTLWFNSGIGTNPFSPILQVLIRNLFKKCTKLYCLKPFVSAFVAVKGEMAARLSTGHVLGPVYSTGENGCGRTLWTVTAPPSTIACTMDRHIPTDDRKWCSAELRTVTHMQRGRKTS